MEIYSCVKVINNKYLLDGVKIGDIGYIIESYDNNFYEVEFSDIKTGESFAQIVLNLDDIERVE